MKEAESKFKKKLFFRTITGSFEKIFLYILYLLA